MRALSLLSTCWLIVLVSGGCGDDDGPSPDASADAGGSDGAAPDGGSPDGGPRTVAIEGDFFRIVTGATTPVEGVEVCVDGHAEVACAMTNAMGAYRLEGVPPATDLLLTFDKDGYLPAQRTVHTPAVRDMALFGFAFGDDDYVAFFETALDLTLDPNLGILTFEATEASVVAVTHAGLEHVTASIDPASGDGPGYADAMQFPAGTLTETSRSGWGYFVNVEPGEYLVTFTHPDRPCVAHPELGWPAPDGSTATTRVTVAAGHVTYTTALCAP